MTTLQPSTPASPALGAPPQPSAGGVTVGGRRRRTARRIALVATLGLAAIGIGAVLVHVAQRRAVEGWGTTAAPRTNTTTTDDDLRARFGPGAPAPSRAAYDALGAYFLEGWANYRSADGARAHYPGAASDAGRRVDGVEGFSRIFPLAAAWLASGRPAKLATRHGTLDLADALARGVVAGTDPASAGWWGRVSDYSPMLVESADIALALWMSRDTVWARLDASERRRVAEWLGGALDSEPHEGNWLLFPLIVHRAMRALGLDTARWDERIRSRWEFYRSFHRGDGWFDDPPHGTDYYNAWGHHYSLFWLHRIDPTLDPAFIRDAQRAFAGTYRHLFGPQGHPPLGRSSCYRMAAPVPLLTAQAIAPGTVSRGEALRALDLTWRVFIGRGAVAHGSVTQGFCAADPATLAHYSGPASCLSSLRSLVVAIALDGESGLLDAPREPLPVERGDFSLPIPAAGWTVSGTRATGRIVIEIDGRTPGIEPPLEPYTLRHRALETLTRSPRRPDNNDALYGRRRYTNDLPVTGCPLSPAR